jgi:diaminohydroxyphosphoribosylaminopyrimidine deaminase / 5-amino-6-(5-phosphoribosylamino)uracil reductase
VTSSDDDLRWMRLALDWSRRCPPVSSAFNVGAVVVRNGIELAYGYSRETDEKVHAEESALAKLAGMSLTGATVYTTLEPCSRRASRPRTCTQLIIEAGLAEVVYALREPLTFVDCEGVELLAAAGLAVRWTPELAGEVIEINAHLLRS